MNNESYVVAGTKPWNRRVFDESIGKLPGQWYYADGPDELTLEHLEVIKPRYIFFLHWSSKVPDDIINTYECVCFHMADVPYGRGGSPLQNLIVRGHRSTKLTALRMVHDFDAGPVYMKSDLSLDGSTAEEIYIRATHTSAAMIKKIISEHPNPIAQTGKAVNFKRRKPSDSCVPELDSLKSLHDFIRMLDAEGYPKAFIDHAGFRLEFHRAALYDGRILADVTITKLEKDTH